MLMPSSIAGRSQNVHTSTVATTTTPRRAANRMSKRGVTNARTTLEIRCWEPLGTDFDMYSGGSSGGAATTRRRASSRSGRSSGANAPPLRRRPTPRLNPRRLRRHPPTGRSAAASSAARPTPPPASASRASCGSSGSRAISRTVWPFPVGPRLRVSKTARSRPRADAEWGGTPPTSSSTPRRA